MTLGSGSVGRFAGEHVLYVGSSEEETSSDSVSEEGGNSEVFPIAIANPTEQTQSPETLTLDPDQVSTLLEKLLVSSGSDEEGPPVVSQQPPPSLARWFVRQETTVTNEDVDNLTLALRDRNAQRGSRDRVDSSEEDAIGLPGPVITKQEILPVSTSIKIIKKAVTLLKSEFATLLQELDAPQRLLNEYLCASKKPVPPLLRRPRAFSNGEERQVAEERVQCTVTQFISLLRDRNAPTAILQKYLPALFIEVLENKKLRKVVDITKDLSVHGYNPLHAIASQPFTLFEKILLKHSKDPCFSELIAEKTKLEAESPLHLICRRQNAPMLEFLLELQNSNMRALLVESCMQKTKTEQCNAFLALGHSLLDDKVNQAYSLKMFDLLVTLYEPKAAITLLREQEDAKGRKFMALVHESQQEQLIIRVSNLMSQVGAW